MTMTDERLAELDAKAGMALTGPKATDDFAAALVMAYPDLRAHIDAQAATIARLRETLRYVVDGHGCQPGYLSNGTIQMVRAALTGAA